MTESQADKAYTELKDLIVEGFKGINERLDRIEQDISQLKQDVSQLKQDVNVIADILNLERDAKGRLRKTA